MWPPQRDMSSCHRESIIGEEQVARDTQEVKEGRPLSEGTGSMQSGQGAWAVQNSPGGRGWTSFGFPGQLAEGGGAGVQCGDMGKGWLAHLSIELGNDCHMAVGSLQDPKTTAT
jgi:hypothetical protein